MGRPRDEGSELCSQGGPRDDPPGSGVSYGEEVCAWDALETRAWSLVARGGAAGWPTGVKGVLWRGGLCMGRPRDEGLELCGQGWGRGMAHRRQGCLVARRAVHGTPSGRGLGALYCREGWQDDPPVSEMSYVEQFRAWDALGTRAWSFVARGGAAG